jgi:hypothetical protein
MPGGDYSPHPILFPSTNLYVRIRVYLFGCWEDEIKKVSRGRCKLNNSCRLAAPYTYHSRPVWPLPFRDYRGSSLSFVNRWEEVGCHLSIDGIRSQPPPLLASLPLLPPNPLRPRNWFNLQQQRTRARTSSSIPHSFYCIPSLLPSCTYLPSYLSSPRSSS